MARNESHNCENVRCIIHNILNKNVKEIQESLPTLLQHYPETVFEFNEEGFLPLHKACIHHPKNLQIVYMILKSHPDGVLVPSKSVDVHANTDQNAQYLRAQKFHGMCPLHIAAINEASLDVIRLLTFENPDTLTKKDKNGNTALSLAIKYNAKTKIVNFLLAENDMLSSMLDRKGNTPLHIACMQGYCEDVVETILNIFPAALEIKNRDGFKPLDLAIKSSCCSDEVIDLLAFVSYGAQEIMLSIDDL